MVVVNKNYNVPIETGKTYFLYSHNTTKSNTFLRRRFGLVSGITSYLALCVEINLICKFVLNILIVYNYIMAEAS